MHARRRCTQPHGFTLVEAAFSIVIVGVMVVAALAAVRSSVLTRRQARGHAEGSCLAEGLMSEILSKSYADPDITGLFGPEGGESSGSRSAFDDVDDYHQWSASPPQDADGQPIEGLSGWKREVVVDWVSPFAPDTPSGTDTGLKRITVTVFRDNVPAATLVSLKRRESR